MSVKIIQERLESYHPFSWQEEELGLKEIFQEVALSALGRTDFFKKAVFQGGTALRILYSLERFSEDLDFVLKNPDLRFDPVPYLKPLVEDFQTYGIPIEVQDRARVQDPVKKIFLKQDSEGMLLTLRYQPRSGRSKKVRIKLEIDTNPPLGNRCETRYLDFPAPVAISVQDLPSLFAGKNHALLCREYTKGRDWYDFLWYVARKTPINFEFLGNACHQQGPWQGQEIEYNKEWYLQALEAKIRSLNWEEAKNDVSRFLKPRDLATLDLWGANFFLDRVQKMRGYLS